MSGEGSGPTSATAERYELGVSRPDLRVEPVPSPEQAFGLDRVGRSEVVRYVLGPSFIALGAAVGSGEWLLGPLAVGQGGFRGIFFIILVSAVLQAAFNYETARYTLATGEPAIAGWGRVPPGWVIWIPISLFLLVFAHIFGGWATGAGQSVLTLFTRRPPTGSDVFTAKVIAVGLLVVCILIIAASRRVSRMIERISLVLVLGILGILLAFDIALVPLDLWIDAIAGFVTPAVPGGTISATQLGAIAGYAGMTAGLNWFVLGHYRDKGYAMGHYTGYLGGMRAQSTGIAAAGVTFEPSAENTTMWRRWRGYLRIEMWGVFLPFALLGMLLPCLLMAHLVRTSGQVPTIDSVTTYIPQQLSAQLGPVAGGIAAIVGAFVFFTTLLAIFDGLARTVVDAAAASTNDRLQALCRSDARRLYFPVLIGFAVLIAMFVNLAVPAQLITISGNIAAMCMLVFPWMLIYLNRRLPGTARLSKIGLTLLLANVAFFGTFSINFLVETFTGRPLFTL